MAASLSAAGRLGKDLSRDAPERNAWALHEVE
jgi:hypothetical protein